MCFPRATSTNHPIDAAVTGSSPAAGGGVAGAAPLAGQNALGAVAPVQPGGYVTPGYSRHNDPFFVQNNSGTGVALQNAGDKTGAQRMRGVFGQNGKLNLGS